MSPKYTRLYLSSDLCTTLVLFYSSVVIFFFPKIQFDHFLVCYLTF